eukprot:COSAG06_NODE_17728_length_924_cov_1.991515_1_plen_24_part_10
MFVPSLSWQMIGCPEGERDAEMRT